MLFATFGRSCWFLFYSNKGGDICTHPLGMLDQETTATEASLNNQSDHKVIIKKCTSID